MKRLRGKNSHDVSVRSFPRRVRDLPGATSEGKMLAVVPRPFISYAREDGEMARRLFDDLRVLGAEPWFDQKDLVGGQDWQGTIRDAVRACSHFIALLSSNSVNKRGFVQKELRQAIDILAEFPPGQIFVIPVRLDDVQPTHEEIRKLHWVDLFPSYQEGLLHLARSMGLPVSPPDSALAHGSLGGIAMVGAVVAVLSLLITRSSHNFIGNVHDTRTLASTVTPSQRPSAAVMADQQLVAANFESVSKLHGDLRLQTQGYTQQITLGRAGTYAINRDELSQEAQELLRQLVSPIAKGRIRTLVQIAVFAHTDAVPIRGIREARSNWSLSAARAARVAEFLEHAGVEPSLLLPVAPGQYQPLFSPHAATRGENRRLELRLDYADKPSRP